MKGTTFAFFILALTSCAYNTAASVCADQPDGTLLEHADCDKFYECSNGEAISFSCPNDLVYNDRTKTCDWKDNVDCGNRNIRDNPTNKADVVKDAEDLDINICQYDNDVKEVKCNDGGISEDAKVDLVVGENEDQEINERSYKEEAEAICKGTGSDDALLPHDDCDKFYKCYKGYPVEFECPINPVLLYNIGQKYCDWPSNVDCGDRNTP